MRCSIPARPSRLRRLTAAIVLCAVLAACSGSPGGGAATRGNATPTVGSVLDRTVPASVGSLPLVDQNGRRVTLASLRGKVVVLVDFLTLCQEICPLTSVDMSQLDTSLRQSGLTDRVEILEVTVDPQRDTRRRLAAYQKIYGAQPNWRFVTGPAKDLNALWAFFGVSHQKVPEAGTPAPRDWMTGKPLTYDVTHQDIVWVLGPDGHAVWEDDGTPYTHGQAPPGKLNGFLTGQGLRNLHAKATAATWSTAQVAAAVRYALSDQVG